MYTVVYSVYWRALGPFPAGATDEGTPGTTVLPEEERLVGPVLLDEIVEPAPLESPQLTQ